MANNKIIAVLVVAVVVVAALGAFIILKGGNDTVSRDSVETALPIMGNANGDYTIDNGDLEIIEKVRDGELNLKDYPLADVNNDGKVDQTDVDLVKKLINREPMTIFMIDHEDNIVSLSYPLKNIISINSDMLPMINQAGGTDALVGFIASSYPNQQSIVLNNDKIEKLVGARAIEEGSYRSIIEIDSRLNSQGGIGAILAMNDSALGNYKSDLVTAGIPIVKIKCSEPMNYIDGVLTMGFLIGGDCEIRSLDYTTESYDVLKNIEDKVGSVSKKQTCISLSMGTYLTQKRSSYTMVTQLAGGNNIIDLEGTSSTNLSSPEAITKYDGVQHIISFRTLDYEIVDVVTSWDRYANTLKASSSYENLVYINAAMPVIARVAYAAEVMYPDLFPGYGNEIFQKFVDKYESYMHDLEDDGYFDVKTDVTTLITYETYMNAKS